MDQQVTNVTVTAVDYNYDPADGYLGFWVEDAAGPMLMYTRYNSETGMNEGAEIGAAADAALAPGDKVSFQALEAANYFGIREFTEIANFTIESSGNPVHVTTLSDGTPLTLDHVGYVVELWGDLVSPPSDCGNECFDFDYNGGIVQLRVVPGGFYEGDSVHWIGPVTEFFDELQLNASDFDWVRWY